MRDLLHQALSESSPLAAWQEVQETICPLPHPVLNELVILGKRRIEERTDFWIL